MLAIMPLSLTVSVAETHTPWEVANGYTGMHVCCVV
jgi:hypothetical protein